MVRNDYIPFASEIKEVIRHTDKEYTFRMAYEKTDVRPGQFFEISMPKYGEAPISVSGIDEGKTIDFTIRKVGVVTNEVFENYVGDSLLIRGPYGNGFDVNLYQGKDLIVVAGGTGVSPVRGVIDYFATHPGIVNSLTAIVGFRSPQNILFHEDLERWKDKMNLIVTVDRDDSNTFPNVGMVTKYIPDLEIADVSNTHAIVVGPPPMMHFTCLGLLGRDIPEENIWISQERKMCCGLGKCGHCRVGETYICLDGPVFNYTKGKTMID